MVFPLVPSAGNLWFSFQIFSVILGGYFSLKTEFLRIFANMVAMEAVERSCGVGETFQLQLLELVRIPDPFTSQNS